MLDTPSVKPLNTHRVVLAIDTDSVRVHKLAPAFNHLHPSL